MTLNQRSNLKRYKSFKYINKTISVMGDRTDKSSGEETKGGESKRETRSTRIPEVERRDTAAQDFKCKLCHCDFEKTEAAIFLLPDDSKIQPGLKDGRKHKARPKRELITCKDCYRKKIFENSTQDKNGNQIPIEKPYENLSVISKSLHIASWRKNFVLFRNVVKKNTPTAERIKSLLEDKNLWKPTAYISGGATARYMDLLKGNAAEELYKMKLPNELAENARPWSKDGIAGRVPVGEIGDLVRLGSYLIRGEDIKFRPPNTFSVLENHKNKLKRQLPHGDAASQEFMSLILYLGEDGCSPTMFHKTPIPLSSLNHLGVLKDSSTMQMMDVEVRRRMTEKYKCLLTLDPEQIGNDMTPCIDKYQYGDLLLFNSQDIHCGPETERGEERVMLFTNMTIDGYNYLPEDESQITPLMVAQAVYGELDPRYYAIVHAWKNNNYYGSEKADIDLTFTDGMNKRYKLYERKIESFLTDVWDEADEPDVTPTKKKKKKKT